MKQAHQDAKWPPGVIKGNAFGVAGGIGSGVSMYGGVAGTQTYNAANLVAR